MKRISNSDCRSFVQEREPFQGSNLYAIHLDQGTDNYRYIVFSWGEHYPMFIYTNGCWFENEDKYSRSTTKHQTQAHPRRPTILLSTYWMKVLANEGYHAIAKERILGSPARKQSQSEALIAYFGG